MAFRISIGTSEEYKLVVLVRNDLKMGKGKIAAQVGHASVEAALYAEKKNKRAFDAWMSSGQAKIVLRVDSLDELLEFGRIAKGNGIHVTSIVDAGRTQIEPGSMTCIALGPAPIGELDKITGELKML